MIHSVVLETDDFHLPPATIQAYLVIHTCLSLLRFVSHHLEIIHVVFSQIITRMKLDLTDWIASVCPVIISVIIVHNCFHIKVGVNLSKVIFQRKQSKIFPLTIILLKICING